SGAATGPRSVTVTTPNGTSPSFPGFTVNPGPSISGISPSSGAQASIVPATITGIALSGATAVTFSGTGVTATIGTGGTATSLPVTISIDAAAPLGTRTVTATTTSGTSVPFTGFTVNAASPACIATPPNLISWWPGNGNTVDVIRGNNGVLQNGATFSS